MINVIPTERATSRTFGWVQDPSSFRSLCDVVAIFDPESAKHRDLIENRIPELVELQEERTMLIEALKCRPLKLSYSNLVGTGFTPRSSARCNGIVQATVKGQVRPFIGDWPADNFVRWAHAFAFIRYNYADDTFEITDTGRDLVRAGAASYKAETATTAETETPADFQNNSEVETKGKINDTERELLIDAILGYPPAVRILKLLAETEDTHLTKFELGRRLGFVGEDGFTNLPQSVLIKSLAKTKTAAERSQMKSDWDGSSDKYARMIGKWLEKLGLAEQIEKQVTAVVGGETYMQPIGQAYIISAKGIKALNRTKGKSRYKRIAKNISFEMMATKGADREYRRTRRTYILKIISEKEKVTFDEIQSYLQRQKIQESISTIKDDVQGLVNIGLDIEINEDRCQWQDCINDFILPLAPNLMPSDLSKLKDEVRGKLTDISHEYLSLIDLAYDSVQNRLFEMKTIALLTDECGYSGMHMGGSRKPDGIIYTTELEENYGIIVDTKAYSKGYSLPISQADEMERYVRENQTRDRNVNPNEWWKNFGAETKTFYFMFVAGHFTGSFESQLERISLNTGIKGIAMNVTDLLLLANSIKSGAVQLGELQILS